MYKVIVFAGTTEGYELCRFLQKHKISTLACVATEYGKESLAEDWFLRVQAKRLTQEEMEGCFKEEQPRLVLDATHPYAAEVTENIRAACKGGSVTYVRVLRRGSGSDTEAVYVESTEKAVEYLQNTTGNILLTTGSKELQKYTALSNYQERIYARVLSLTHVLETCAELGIEGKHLIGMQGPFSKELNMAMLRQYDCRYLVTKDTGKSGGFEEKIEAAISCGVLPVIIGRPLKEEGMSVTECKRMLADRFGCRGKQSVTLLGIGMGSMGTLTVDGKHALKMADLVIGAKRMADAVRLPHHEVVYEYRSREIAEFVRNHPEYERIVIALSGDVGFYSGCRKLLEELDEEPQILCGISSVSYFMAKIGLSWDDAELVSAHGKEANLIHKIAHHEKVFAILGTKDGVSELSQKLVKYGFSEVLLYVGENLSYPNEKIEVKKAAEWVDYEGDALSVVCAYHKDFMPQNTTHGIRDAEFIRGKAPMTKEEVRTVSLSKLRLTKDAVCYDIGAGTGSVSIEMALRAYEGHVYAIEKKEEAAELMEQNRIKFCADNLTIIRGTAPDTMKELPSPTHAFIGGSSGNLKEIVALLLEKNPKVQIVINCITLETITEVMELCKEESFAEFEIVQMNVSRAKELGSYHLMMGENPIYIITCKKES